MNKSIYLVHFTHRNYVPRSNHIYSINPLNHGLFYAWGGAFFALPPPLIIHIKNGITKFLYTHTAQPFLQLEGARPKKDLKIWTLKNQNLQFRMYSTNVFRNEFYAHLLQYFDTQHCETNPLSFQLWFVWFFLFHQKKSKSFYMYWVSHKCSERD